MSFMKKRLFTLALCIIMAFTMGMSAFAEGTPQWIEGETIVVDLTYEEFVEKTAELNEISEEEAIQLIDEMRRSTAPNGVTAYTDVIEHYQSVSKTFTYSKNSNYRAESVATLLLRGKGSYFQIEGVSGCATRIGAGTSTASWVQLYNNYHATFPSSSIDFSGSGYFSDSVTSSTGVSVGIEGFNYSHSSGNTFTYYSDTMNLIWTYRTY